jgi:hypothetical protein
MLKLRGGVSRRRVFNPIRIDMRHSKVQSVVARHQRGAGGRGHVRRLSTPNGGASQGQPRGEELIFKASGPTALPGLPYGS